MEWDFDDYTVSKDYRHNGELFDPFLEADMDDLEETIEDELLRDLLDDCRDEND